MKGFGGYDLCGEGCQVCGEILSTLTQPLWFCRICRYVHSNPRVVRRHLRKLMEEGRMRQKKLGGLVLYEAD